MYKSRFDLSLHQFHLEIQDAFICCLRLKLTDTGCFEKTNELKKKVEIPQDEIKERKPSRKLG